MLKNTENSYGSLTKLFHWTVALLIIAMLVVGNVMTGMENTPTKFEVYFIHKSIGVMVLLLVAMRFSWRLMNIQPRHDDIAKWQKIASDIVHKLLYVCMFAMPMSGWAMSSAAGRPVSFFGLFTLPDIVAADRDMAGIYAEAHELIGWAIVALLCAHVGAALMHHFIFRDRTLKRMLP
jgi:cytochrome b561